MAKFSPVGDHGQAPTTAVRTWDDSWGVAKTRSAAYICGTTLSTTGIATAGAHQTVYATQDDAYLGQVQRARRQHPVRR